MPNQNKECQQNEFSYNLQKFCYIFCPLSSFTQCRCFYRNILYHPNIRNIWLIECGPYQSSPIRAKTHNQIFIFVVRLAIILTHTTLTFPRDFADHVSMLSFHHKLSIVSAARPPPASVTAFNPSGSGAVEGHLIISLATLRLCGICNAEIQL